jgi:hypothetical protein
MKHTWTIEPSDIEKVKTFFDFHRDDVFVRQRIEWNLWEEKPSVDKAEFWQQMVACLLTTQQRSGPTCASRRAPWPTGTPTAS